MATYDFGTATGNLTVGTGTVHKIVNAHHKEMGIAQVDVPSGSATVELYGRQLPSMAWVLIDTLTTGSSAAKQVALMTEMAFRITSYSAAGTIKMVVTD